jgi:2',3'-cyclic-nucleotide 2'-phosphodiesterase (5'-nucleotidase family)
LPRLFELVSMMNTKPVCCNFQKIGESNSYFDPYKIVSYGSVDIAYIGVTTPETISSSSPAQFKDENGEFLYTFHPTDLYDTVQKYIDAAKSDGAEYVVALSHIGDNNGENVENVYDLIENTRGLDVVLDGHAHSVIEGKDVKDKSGKEVRLSSTGTKFENIGKLTIRDGKISTELVKTETYEKTDSAVDAYLEKINSEYSTLGERKIAVSDVDLITHDTDGKRLIRTEETNLGNLCGDAFRTVLGADVGYAYGGGIRNAISKGDITFNDILSVFPFNNQVVLCEITGQVLLDVLEFSLARYPEENGCFPQMSGVTFSVDTSITSSVVTDKNEEFVEVSGEYRVYNVKVYDKESGEYLPLDLLKRYTFSSFNYTILEYGSGMTMFKGAKILKNDGMLDVELLEIYITEHLNGHIGEEYRETKHAITFTEGKP